MRFFEAYDLTTHPPEGHDGFNRFMYHPNWDFKSLDTFYDLRLGFYQIHCHLGQATLPRLPDTPWYRNLDVTPVFDNPAWHRTVPLYVVTTPAMLDDVLAYVTSWVGRGTSYTSFFEQVVERKSPNPGRSWALVDGASSVFITDVPGQARRFYLECHRPKAQIDYDSIRIGDSVVTHYKPSAMQVTTLGPGDRIGAKLAFGRIRTYHPHDVWPADVLRDTVLHAPYFFQTL